MNAIALGASVMASVMAAMVAASASPSASTSALTPTPVSRPSSAAPPATTVGARLPLGVTYAGWKGELAHATEKIATFRDVGFRMVSFVPTYAYDGMNHIDLLSGPDAAELAGAVEAALRADFTVVIKPHLDPPAYRPGFDAWRSPNHSWRVHCPWRGFFDVDPMADDYRSGIVFSTLQAVKTAVDRRGDTESPAIRVELGAELMNSVVYGPERWEQLLAAAKKERHRLGLDAKVALSHNFTHHFEILDDFVGRMNARQRVSLARYIRGLDAIALSQYMDLTDAVPAGERDRRLPTVDEVARALVLHEKRFREDILQGALRLRPGDVPPLHIGEFGVGRGGLKHPNLWDGAATPAEETTLAHEIARGHQGLLRYLSLGEGRTAKSAVLWVTGPHYDIFGWGDQKHAIPEAAAAIKSALHPPPQ